MRINKEIYPNSNYGYNSLFSVLSYFRKSSCVSKFNYYGEISWYSIFNILPGCINIVFIGGLVFLIDSKY